MYALDFKHLLTLLQLYRQAVSHLERATTERKYYKDACEESSKQVPALITEDDIYYPPPNSSHQPNSLKVCVHYSFDFAQQVHLPSDPLQLRSAQMWFIWCHM